MKKTLLLAAFAIAGSLAYAQKPSAGNKTAEVNLNFQTGTAPVTYNLPAELRLRYFLADDAAVRIRFGLGSSTAKSSVTNGTNTADITNKTGFALTLSPGYEKHFEGTSKLSPYAGAQLTIGLGGAASTEVTNASVASPTPGQIVVGDSYSDKAGSTFGLGLGLMMGADYYVTDGVFLGVEFGLNLFSMTSTGEGETTTKIGGASTTTKSPKSSTSDLFGVYTGGVRLGFVF